MENSPSPTGQANHESVEAVVSTINDCEQERLRHCRKMFDELEPVQVECIQKAKKRVRREIVCVRTTDEEGKGRRQPKSQKNRDMPTAPPKKKARRMSLSRIRCCVEGCGKKLICSKNWKKCAKCKQRLLPFSCETLS